MKRNFLKKDSATLGIILGLFSPVLLFLVIRGGVHLIEAFVADVSLKFHYTLLLSTIINLLTLRYYLVNLKYEKTGKGILGVTFVYIILYFLFFHP